MCNIATDTLLLPEALCLNARLSSAENGALPLANAGMCLGIKASDIAGIRRMSVSFIHRRSEISLSATIQTNSFQVLNLEEAEKEHHYSSIPL